MLTPRTRCSFIYILTFNILAVLIPLEASAQSDATADADTTEVKVKKKDLAGHQLMLGVDLFRPAVRLFTTDKDPKQSTDRYAYELAVNYYLHNEYYLAGEAGWGGSSVKYTDLTYTTTNQFLRFGFNKSVLTRDKPDDWDMLFIGLGAGVADVKRSNASYTIVDSLWGNTAEAFKGRPSFVAYWAELTGGVRVELAKNIFAGWTGRLKFLMNGKSFNDLAPIYIAGFGKGDKNSSIDLNIYISYTIRWKRKTAGAADNEVKPVLPASGNTSDSSHVATPIPGGNK